MPKRKAEGAADKTACRELRQRVVYGSFERIQKPTSAYQRRQRIDQEAAKQDRLLQMIDATRPHTTKTTTSQKHTTAALHHHVPRVSSSIPSTQQAFASPPASRTTASQCREPTSRRLRQSRRSTNAREYTIRTVVNLQLQPRYSSITPRSDTIASASVTQDTPTAPQPQTRAHRSARVEKTSHFADMTTDGPPVYKKVTDDERRALMGLPPLNKDHIDLSNDKQDNKGTIGISAQVIQPQAPHADHDDTANPLNASEDATDFESQRNNVAFRQLRRNVMQQRQTLESALENPQLSRLSQGR